jgi:hypothetical protein
MEADEDVIVEVEGETTPTNDTPAESNADPVADLQAQYDELQKDKQQEADRAAAAERIAGQERNARLAAEQEVQSVRTDAIVDRLASVQHGLSAAEAATAAAKSEYKAALEVGDWTRAAEAQEKLADARHDYKSYQARKAELEVNKSERQVERRYEPPDPVEAFIAGRDAGTQAWLRAHMDDARVLATGSNTRRGAKLNAADNDAVAEGYARGSSEYFAHVERFLGMTKAETNAGDGGTKAKTNGANREGSQTKRPASAPVAPVNGGGGVQEVTGGTIVRLTQNQKLTATDGTLIWNYDDPSGKKLFKKGDPIGIQEYARRLKAQKADGTFDKSEQ